ncbi:hypothetical protein BMS3Abin07_02155 [bacterium BMS3Abin07]|nr:hypothetical protein BMS3Abin07_02155 [bacterium BMS3Abin07]
MKKPGITIFIIVTLVLVTVFSGCRKNGTSSEKKSFSNKTQQTSSKPAEQPVAPEKNPTGDIPDTQAFVKYSSSQGGYELEVPEGWARTTNGMDVTFTYKLDGLSVKVTNTTKPPSAQSIRTNEVKQLKRTGRAVVIKSIKDIKLAGGPIVRMVYESNSEPNPVTTKQVRLKKDTYFYYKNGKLAELGLWAPIGADNVDQWNRISNSFSWR